MDFFTSYIKSLKEILGIINFPSGEREEFVASFLVEALKNASFDLIELINLENKIISEENIQAITRELLTDIKVKKQLQLKLIAILQAFADNIASDFLEKDKAKVERIMQELAFKSFIN